MAGLTDLDTDAGEIWRIHGNAAHLLPGKAVTHAHWDERPKPAYIALNSRSIFVRHLDEL